MKIQVKIKEEVFLWDSASLLFEDYVVRTKEKNINVPADDVQINQYANQLNKLYNNNFESTIKTVDKNGKIVQISLKDATPEQKFIAYGLLDNDKKFDNKYVFVTDGIASYNGGAPIIVVANKDGNVLAIYDMSNHEQTFDASFNGTAKEFSNSLSLELFNVLRGLTQNEYKINGASAMSAEKLVGNTLYFMVLPQDTNIKEVFGLTKISQIENLLKEPAKKFSVTGYNSQEKILSVEGMESQEDVQVELEPDIKTEAKKMFLESFTKFGRK